MIKQPYDQLKELARTQLCGVCREPLNLVQHTGENCQTLMCYKGHYPDSLVRNPSVPEEFKQGKLGDDIAQERAKKYQRSLPAKGKAIPRDQPMGYLPTVDLDTGELLTPEAVRALISYAQRYELDPYRGHVVIMHGKPYISLDGYLYHANQTNNPYTLKSRPLTGDERETYQIPEGAHAWVAEVIKAVSNSSFTGLGIITREEILARSVRHPEALRSPVVAAHPWQMAQKRAEWQAMRRAFQVGSQEEVEEKVQQELKGKTGGLVTETETTEEK